MPEIISATSALSSNEIIVRAGCKDIWNAFMSEGATFGKHDIPFCPTTASDVPKSQVTWEEAKQLHRKIFVKTRITILMHILIGI